MPYASRDGVTLYYQQAGSGAPPLVFVHGWCCDHTFFQPQFDALQASHAVVTLDLRGCGRSDRSEDGYDVPTLADDVAWLCQDIGISKPVVIGHSLGGMIAIELAARHPSLPAAIIAADPGPIDPTPEDRDFFEGFLAELEGPDQAAVRLAFIEGSFLATDDADRKRAIIDTMCSAPGWVAAAGIRGVLAWDGLAALRRCNVPVLVMQAQTGGSNDPARLLARKPDIQIGVTVGTGHFHQLEVPEQVTPMIERFLRVAIPAPVV